MAIGYFEMLILLALLALFVLVLVVVVVITRPSRSQSQHTTNSPKWEQSGGTPRPQPQSTPLDTRQAPPCAEYGGNATATTEEPVEELQQLAIDLSSNRTVDATSDVSVNANDD